MAEVTAALVKQLREQTGAGMMDCKKALTESAGELDAATDWLRKKGLAAAAKKAGRVAAEGLVCALVDGGNGVAIEVNAETDFVARNDTFQKFVLDLGELALESGDDFDALNGRKFPGGDRSVSEEVTHLIATVGENMNFRRLESLQVGDGVVAAYVHNALADGLGKIAVLVALESGADQSKLLQFGRQLAMHVAAASPLYLDRSSVDQTALDRERDVLAEQARSTGKSEDIIAKMVEGRLRKYYEEVVLLDQTYVIDGESKVGKAVEAMGKELGAPVVVKGFVRFVLGEGIEKDQADFAAEVQAQVSG